MNFRQFLEEEMCIYLHITPAEVNSIIEAAEDNGCTVYGLCGLIRSGLRAPGIVKEPDVLIIHDPSEVHDYCLFIEHFIPESDID